MSLSARFRLPVGARFACALRSYFVLLALALCVVSSARAQNTTSDASGTATAIAAKRVSVDAEDATLASVITALMQNVGANYTLDNTLRQIRVTAHLHNLPLQTTLDVLLRGATPPVMVRVENGVYSFLPRPAADAPAAESVAAPNDIFNPGGIRHIQVARVNFIDAAEAARLLGGIPIVTSGQTYGLVDPNKLGLIGPGSGSAAGNRGNAAGGAAGGAGTAAPGGTPGTAGAGASSATVPANFLDYLWIVNAGAGI